MEEVQYNAESVARSDVDDMSLNELIEIAQRTVVGYYAWSDWLEDYYDPAKSALVDLLAQLGVIDPGYV